MSVDGGGKRRRKEISSMSVRGNPDRAEMLKEGWRIIKLRLRINCFATPLSASLEVTRRERGQLPAIRPDRGNLFFLDTWQSPGEVVVSASQNPHRIQWRALFTLDTTLYHRMCLIFAQGLDAEAAADHVFTVRFSSKHAVV